VATGPYVPGSPLDAAATAHKNVYPNVVYYAVNGIADSRIAMSIDGGITFPFASESFPAAPSGEGLDCGGGLHGNVVAGPDGTVYIPSRNNCQGPGPDTHGGPIVAVSRDNGLTWTHASVADDVGTPDNDKNSDIAVDTNNTAYIAFPGGDNRMWLSVSGDHGATWSKAVVMTPDIGTTTMPALVAGSPGRIAVAYYGVWTPEMSRDEADDPMEVPDHVRDEARWGLFVTYSLDALSDAPTFTTVRVTGDDPIQVGGVSTNSGDSDGAERNLLDFLDAQLDKDGRLHVAFADGCTSSRCKGPEGEPDDSRDDLATYAVLETGPSLFEEKGWLAARATSAPPA
jgi:hypothetical protein